MEKDKTEDAQTVAIRKAGKVETKKISRKVGGSANGIPLHEVPHYLVSVNDGAENSPQCIIQGQTIVSVGRPFKKGTVTIEYVTPAAHAAFHHKVKLLAAAELAK